MEGDELAGLIAGVVVLVPRARRRRDAGPLVPVVAFRFFPFVSHKGVASGVEQKNMGAGTMAVRFFVAADRKLRDVSEHRAARHVDIHIARALAPLLPRHEVDLADVGDEVRVQNTAVVFREIFSLFGEKFRVAGIEAVFEHIIRVVDELRIAEELK